MLRTVCRRNAGEIIAEKPAELIRLELQSIENTSSVTHHSIRLALYRVRRKTVLTLPKSLEETLQQLSHIPVITSRQE